MGTGGAHSGPALGAGLWREVRLLHFDTGLVGEHVYLLACLLYDKSWRSRDTWGKKGVPWCYQWGRSSSGNCYGTALSSWISNERPRHKQCLKSLRIPLLTRSENAVSLFFKLHAGPFQRAERENSAAQEKRIQSQRTHPAGKVWRSMEKTRIEAWKFCLVAMRYFILDKTRFLFFLSPLVVNQNF